MEKINDALTILIKVFTVLLLLKVISASGTFSDKYSHYGPDCADSVDNFNFWLDKQSPGGKVVSLHESKIQTENGTTSCYGVFLTKDGAYPSWKGHITELDDGEVVGAAKLVN